MLMGGMTMGGALNPMQLLSTKKKKVKDDRLYRSRNDIEFSDGESLDHLSDKEVDEEAEILNKTSLAFLKK